MSGNSQATAAKQLPTPPGTPNKDANQSSTHAGKMDYTYIYLGEGTSYDNYLHAGTSSFNPAHEARIPLGLPLWERQANPLLSPCPQGQTSYAFKTPRPSTARSRVDLSQHAYHSTTSKSANIPNKQGNSSNLILSHSYSNDTCWKTLYTHTLAEAEQAMMGKGLNRLQHLSWLKNTGIPASNEKVRMLEQEKKGCEQELELLDIQILAIGSMHGTKAYESACYRHLSAKIKFEDKLRGLKKEYSCLLYTSPSPRD